MPHYYWLISCVMMYAKPFSTKTRFKSWTITKKRILTGKLNNSGGLWDIPLTPPSLPAPSANAIVQMNETKKEFSQFLHVTCFSPEPSTCIKAI